MNKEILVKKHENETSMCVHVSIYVCIYQSIHPSINPSLHLSIQIHIYIIHTDTHPSIHPFVFYYYIYLFMHPTICVYMYSCIYIFIYIYIECYSYEVLPPTYLLAHRGRLWQINRVAAVGRKGREDRRLQAGKILSLREAQFRLVAELNPLRKRKRGRATNPQGNPWKMTTANSGEATQGAAATDDKYSGIWGLLPSFDPTTDDPREYKDKVTFLHQICPQKDRAMLAPRLAMQCTGTAWAQVKSLDATTLTDPCMR